MNSGMLKAFLDGMQFEQLIAAIGKFDVRDVVAAFESDQIAQAAYYRIWRCVASAGFSTSDAWLMNMMRGQWEMATGQTILASYPIDVVLPIADICNARCKFCSSWRTGSGFLDPGQVDSFRDILNHAHSFGYQGHGEPLIHPKFDEIVTRISSCLDPRCRSYIITNGKQLNSKLDLLLKAGIQDFNISLNAATPETHERVMKLGKDAFSDILDAIRRLVDLKKSSSRWYMVNISMVLIRDNLEDAAEFVDMGNRLGVDTIRINALAPFKSHLDEPDVYTDLSPAHDPRLSHALKNLSERVAVSKSEVIWYPEYYGNQETWPAEESGKDYAQERPRLTEGQIRKSLRRVEYGSAGRGEILGAPAICGPNPWNRQPPLRCKFPYTHFICTSFDLWMVPCCYMTEVPGAKPVTIRPGIDFFELWNSPAYQRLRTHLRDGPLLDPCKLCPSMAT